MILKKNLVVKKKPLPLQSASKNWGVVLTNSLLSVEWLWRNRKKLEEKFG